MQIDQQDADNIIGQLAGAKQLLAQGRGFGIRLVATTKAIDGLRQSTHPEAEAIIANIKRDDTVSDQP